MKNNKQQSQLFTAEDMTDSVEFPIAFGRVVVYSSRSPDKESVEKETVNEDAAAIIPYDIDSAVLMVADGAGGLRAGAQASEIAVTEITKSVESAATNNSDSLREAILNAIETANKLINGLGIGAATTLAAVEISDHMIRPYHIGDSMILLVGNRGKIKLQTVSHSPVGYAVEAGFLDQEEALHHEERHLVSNLLGMPGMSVAVGEMINLSARDTLLIASDGLFDNAHIEEIVGIIRKGPLASAARVLVDLCHERMQHPADGLPSKPDDLTFVLFRGAKL